ncbi:hypothetical protein O8C76_02330 [Aliarcobacter butzleri]|uniref:SHS2 domain-containing protein n=1 Tax=Aliarcobacter butzleri TaxID=28197 RepID=A0AAW7PV95_9BACT|nr:hypothetical protein [Aliarcobacter butzleri]MDN5069864.1 hypothetical protein [Aliarcobacter butzleri]
MKKTSFVIDLSKEDYIKSYIEKTDSNKTKIYNKNEVEKIGFDGCNSIDTFKAIQSISKAYNLAVKNINEKIDETVIIIGQDYVKMPLVDIEINMKNKIITKNDITKILQDMVKNHEYHNDYIAIQVQSAWFVLDNDRHVLDVVNHKTSILRCYASIYFVDKNIFSNFQEIFSKCGIINPRFKAMFFERKHKYELDIKGNLIELEILSAFEKKSSFGKWLHERKFVLREIFKIFCKKLNQ